MSNAIITVGMIHHLNQLGGSRLNGLTIELTKVVHRHGYAVGRVVKGSREYPKGNELHLPMTQLRASAMIGFCKAMAGV